MEMRSSCLPPVQPTVDELKKQHPRYRDFLRYRASMAAQLVTGSNFDLWLKQTEESENGFISVFELIATTAGKTPGWYKNVFGPNNRFINCLGPFASKIEAEQS